MTQQDRITPFQLLKTQVGIADGRTLNYYDFAPTGETPPYLSIHQEAASQSPPGGRQTLEKSSEMRWHPVRNEWVLYAAHRMNRPQLPTRDACPLCPGVIELPVPYQVAIFGNKAPALSYVPGHAEPAPQVPDTTFDLTLPARGRCDIVVYSQDHDSRFAHMPVEQIYGLIEAWRDRYAELMAEPEISFVSIFENKGREAGMTLDHPHGQIYSFPFIPTDIQQQFDQSVRFDAEGKDLWELVIERELREQSRVIAETDGFLAAMPFYARYPYEVHIWAKRRGVASLLDMTPQERRELSAVMKNVTLRYENMWPNAVYGFPTLMLMQQLSQVPGPERYRFHIEFYPLQRSPDKLKYRASLESAAGVFINDALPENQAAELRAAEPSRLELPPIIFQ